MVDRKEIKWTIYSVLWGWARAKARRTPGSSCTVIAVYSDKLTSSVQIYSKYILIYVLVQIVTNHCLVCGECFQC